MKKRHGWDDREIEKMSAFVYLPIQRDFRRRLEGMWGVEKREKIIE